MTKLLLMEGNTAEKRALAREMGIASSSEVYAAAIAAHYPDFQLDVVNAADPDWALPDGVSFADYDGMVITGSSLHAYDTDFAVTNQIAMTAEFAQTGKPILGSCWGLQIAVMAAGGLVEYNPKGREVGFARKIVPTEAGLDHPMLRGRGAVFDAPCIHYDEVTRLPENATLLASNAHSLIQAAVVPLGRSEVWAVQYHPEFDLMTLANLYRLYADDMVTQGFFADRAGLDQHVALIAGLAANPDDMGLAWQLGVDGDITTPANRRAEIINWVEYQVLGRTF